MVLLDGALGVEPLLLLFRMLVQQLQIASAGRAQSPPVRLCRNMSPFILSPKSHVVTGDSLCGYATQGLHGFCKAPFAPTELQYLSKKWFPSLPCFIPSLSGIRTNALSALASLSSASCRLQGGCAVGPSHAIPHTSCLFACEGYGRYGEHAPPPRVLLRGTQLPRTYSVFLCIARMK